jgi:hypothetical protein
MLSSKKSKHLGKAKYVLTGGQSKTITLKLNNAGLSTLAKRGQVVANVKTVAKGPIESRSKSISAKVVIGIPS